MRLTIALIILPIAVIAAPQSIPGLNSGGGSYPGGGNGGGGNTSPQGPPPQAGSCNSGGNVQVCCNGGGGILGVADPGCIVQALGSTCSSQAKCCNSNAGIGSLININLLNCADLL